MTQEPSSTKTDTKSTSQRLGKYVDWDEESKKEEAINTQIVNDKFGEWIDGHVYKDKDGWITDYDTGAMWFVPNNTDDNDKVDLSKLHGDELVEAIREHWRKNE